MSSFARLRHLFQGITSVTLAATAATACGGSLVAVTDGSNDAGRDGEPPVVIGADGGIVDSGIPADSGIDTSAYTLSVCEGDIYNELAGVTPATPTDYFEIRRENTSYPGQPDTGLANIWTEAKAGVACKTASPQAACESALTSLRSSTGWSPEGPGGGIEQHIYLAYTRGNSVAAVTSLDALYTFLAPLDSVKDAALLLAQRGHRFNCAYKHARATATGYEFVTETGYLCGAGTHTDANVVTVSSSGAIAITRTVRLQNGDPGCAIGRRPNGFEPTGCASLSPLGAYFGNVAELEAASVYAFEDLARDLTLHGAPDALVASAKDAAWDEVRHARMTMKLAHRFGGAPNAPGVPGTDGARRSLFDIALENATEGCVRETFGALQATFQAAHAADAGVARAMRVIAEDETRHAALAWDVATWLTPRLTDDERARVEAAREAAVARLERDLTTPIDGDVARAAGVPDAIASAWLLGQVREVLWS